MVGDDIKSYWTPDTVRDGFTLNVGFRIAEGIFCIALRKLSIAFIDS